jgi:hypothetical protein
VVFEGTFTSETVVEEGPFSDIIQQEKAKGLPHSDFAGGCGERFACGELYNHAGDLKGGHVDMGLYHEEGIGPCPTCARILQRTSNALKVNIELTADGVNDIYRYFPE